MHKLKLHILISLLHMEDQGGRWRLHRHIKKEEEKLRNNNSLNRVWTIIDEQFSNFATEV